MTTVTGKIEDATGAALHAKIDFVSKTTPIAFSGGIIVTNTDKTVRSNPSDGTFSVQLEPGNYTVTISANGQVTTLTIVVPNDNLTHAIDTLISNPISFPALVPTNLWTGIWAGNITFDPAANPVAPTISEVAYSGGNVNLAGAEKYSYWVTYVTAQGETYASPQANFECNLSATLNSANRITLTPNVSGVTAVRIWRRVVQDGHYYSSTFPGQPGDIGLLATVDPSTAYYDDWQSAAQFASSYNPAIVGPYFNSTAGELLSSASNAQVAVTDNGVYFPGANVRVKPGVGLQIYNFDTSLWHTVTVTGNPPQLGVDAGNPN